MDQTRELFRLLAVSEKIREGAAASMAEASSQLPEDAVPTRPKDVLDIAEQGLRLLASHEGGAPAQNDAPDVTSSEWQRALDLLMNSANDTLKRAVRGDAPEPNDSFLAEAVIVADGTRPSFLLCNNTVAPNDPFIRNWRTDLATAELAGYQKLAAAVGRIQPQNGHAARFVGTGSLISVNSDRTEGLILTNKHVIDRARTSFGVDMSPTQDGLVVNGQLDIDFVAEACSLTRNLFTLESIRFPVGAGAVFAGIDAAVARIVPAEGSSTFPEPVDAMSAAPTYANGTMPSLATVGFPAKPMPHGDEVDWDFVLKILFGNAFGVKRLAPGTFTQALGAHPNDTGRRAIGHDATTFGGASGSLVFAWLDAGPPAFALHFAGKTTKSNYALSFAKEQPALAAIGVPLGP